MEFADQAGLDQATSWVSGNAGATQVEASPANAAPAQPPEGGNQNTQGAQPPAGDQPAAPAAPTPEDLTPYRELVDNLGGLEGVRQFDPLYKAATTISDDWGEVGKGLNVALKQLLKGDQYGALAMALYGEYGDLFLEQYLADHPEWLQGKLAELKPAETLPLASGEDDYDESPAQGQQGREPQMSAKERELSDRLAKLEGELNGVRQSREQAAEAQTRARVEKEVFGTIVDKTFGQLEGWEQAELQRVVRMAMSEFSLDSKAAEAFKKADQYLRTGQPLLAREVVNAQNAFQRHLKDAMELVDLKRQAARKAAEPKDPERQEFGAGDSPPADTRQPTAPAQQGNFWDVGELLGAVNRRLQAQGGGARP
jgi:hypothetical protein